MTEADTRANYIDPALKETGWRLDTIKREYYFTDGRKLAGGARGKRSFVDYLLHKNNRNLAIIEAKKESSHPTKGLQEAIDYAQKLLVRFVYSTNGKQIYAFDMQTGKGDYIENYPTPDELELQYSTPLNNIAEKLRSIPFHLEGSMRPRYYQELAIHAATDAIGMGKTRILLTLATGTGKTFIAFQIVHKIFKARWNLWNIGARRPRILFLADRNILADQAINTFNPYEKDLIKINGEEIRKRNGVPISNAHIYFAIYQAIAERENIGGYYKKYPSDFFDLILIDECHRGSANEDGSWRAILDYFNSAVHIGLTATPKRDTNVDTYTYFGTPVYEYSLKDGINDGFLSPYRVKRIHSNIDEIILTPDDQIIEGESTQKAYYTRDFDKKIITDERTEHIAKTILKHIKPMDKTIIFCENQPHALTMRDMINKHKAVNDPCYCVRITSDEGKTGHGLLEKFKDNDKDIPTIITSSQMLTTGVDVHNVRNIVLDRTIESMVEFKQIVGRGTRVYDGKDYFTIIDFRGSTNKFYDEDWDGPPESDEPKGPEVPPSPSPEPPDPHKPGPDGGDGGEDPPPPKIHLRVKLSKHREFKVINIETKALDENGNLLTTQQFIERFMHKLPGLFSSIEELRNIWSDPDERKKLLDKLAQAHFEQEQLNTLSKLFEAEDCDLFDVLAFLAFEESMLTRRTRADAVRQNVAFFAQYEQVKAKAFLHFILNRYEDSGFVELARDRLPTLIELSELGTTNDASQAFGGSATHVLKAFKTMQHQLYSV